MPSHAAQIIAFPKPAPEQLTATHNAGHPQRVATMPLLTLGEERMLKLYQSDMYAAGRGVGTVHIYANRIHILAMQHPHLLAVTTEDLRDFLAARRTTHAAETRKSFRSAFRSFYGWTTETGRTTLDPSYPLKPIPIPASVPRVAPDDVVQLALITADLPTTAMILLARYGCLRLTELTTLRTAQREGDLLRIIGKGEKQRLVPANDELLHVLLTLEREQGPGYYFPGRYGGHLHVSTVADHIKVATGYNPHALRHAGATAAYLANPDLEALRMFLGHSSVATTQRYLHLGMDAVRTVAAGTAFKTPVVNPHDPDRIFYLGQRFHDPARSAA